jgi:hypothetical protein
VKPANIPLGYKAECLEQADRTHRIPFDLREAKSDYFEMATQIDEIHSKSSCPDLPLFAEDENVRDAQDFVDYLWDRVDNPPEKKPQVFSVRFLIRQIVACTGQNTTTKNNDREMQTDEVLKNLQLDFRKGMACRWHETQADAGNCYCSRYKIIRMCDLLAMYCHDQFRTCLPREHCHNFDYIGQDDQIELPKVEGLSLNGNKARGRGRGRARFFLQSS